jgi:hypothetical protein
VLKPYQFLREFYLPGKNSKAIFSHCVGVYVCILCFFVYAVPRFSRILGKLLFYSFPKLNPLRDYIQFMQTRAIEKTYYQTDSYIAFFVPLGFVCAYPTHIYTPTHSIVFAGFYIN